MKIILFPCEIFVCIYMLRTFLCLIVIMTFCEGKLILVSLNRAEYLPHCARMAIGSRISLGPPVT